MTNYKVSYKFSNDENMKLMSAYFTTKVEAFMFVENMRLMGHYASDLEENIIQQDVILSSDSYKYSHWKQYPENTTWIFDYMESRGGLYEVTCFVGLQYYLMKYLSTPITAERVEYAKSRIDAHMGPNIFDYEGWMRIVTVHGGRLPVRIRAVAEGSVVPVKNVLMTMESTDKALAWLPSFLETLLMKVWSPTTVATTSLTAKAIIAKYLEETADNLDGLPFKLHDFGDRGVSSPESAGLCGLAHLVNFMGSDTTSALEVAKHFYGCAMSAFSIPATEHSSMTILGKDGEYVQMKRFIEQFADAKIKACVSDSFDIYKAMDFLGTLKPLLQEQGSTAVCRPDSGCPIKMSLACVDHLASVFGYSTNSKGYKLLDPTVRVIYGDGIDDPMVIRDILENLKHNGYSADNIAFGMGGGLLQKNNRDTQKFAIKCSAAEVDGVKRDVYKDPITDHGKKSKKGVLDLIIDEEGKFQTVAISASIGFKIPLDNSALVTVFENGEVLVKYTLDEMRETADRTAKIYNKEILEYFYKKGVLPTAAEYFNSILETSGDAKISLPKGITIKGDL